MKRRETNESQWIKWVKQFNEAMNKWVKTTQDDPERMESVKSLARYILSPIIQGKSTSLGRIPSFTWPPQPAGCGTCLAVSSNLRRPTIPNARVSCAEFSIDCVNEYMGGNSTVKKDLGRYGSQFFSEFYEVYFNFFGRGNTLNEMFLDNYIKDGRKECRLISVCYSDVSSSAKFQARYDSGSKTLFITIDSTIAAALSGQGVYSKAFWDVAWQTFLSTVNEAHCSQDWVPAAVNRLRALPVSESGRPSQTLFDALAHGRKKAEEILLGENGGLPLAPRLREIYLDDSVPLTECINRLLLMLQGNLCLVPWATIPGRNTIPCPVLIVPAEVDGPFSSWTFVTIGQHPASEWTEVRAQAEGFFEKAAKHLKEEKAISTAANCLTQDLNKSVQESAAGCSLELILNRLGPILALMCHVAKRLTGVMHESRPISFSFILGKQETLKYVDRVLSNEFISNKGETDAFSPHRDLLSSETDAEKKEKWAELQKIADLASTRIEGHYALFQRPHVAGFVDLDHKSLRVDRMVMLNDPPASDLLRMQEQDSILLDEYVRLRWLTWKVKDTTGFCSGGDGVLRIFYKGKLALMWRKRVNPEDHHSMLGIEWDSSGEDSPIKQLRSCIQDAIGETGERTSTYLNSMLSNIISSICSISNANGEGSLFVIGGDRECTALCDMVQDTFKMEWAKERRLLDTEQQTLRSLATMDGAVHICLSKNGTGGNGAWVRARRYIAAAPANPLEPKAKGPLDASDLTNFIDWCVELLPNGKVAKPCSNKLEGCFPILGKTSPESLRESLGNWKGKLGSKGTRHRSVFQLCLWSSEQKNRRFFGAGGSGVNDQDAPLICSISADGPVHLYRMYYCKKRDKTLCKGCPAMLLWTQRIIG